MSVGGGRPGVVNPSKHSAQTSSEADGNLIVCPLLLASNVLADSCEPANLLASFELRHSYLAHRGESAAGRPDATHRRAHATHRGRSIGADPHRGIPRGTWEARLDRGPQYPDRHPLDGNRRRPVDATICEGTRRLQPDLIV